jgi:hypothetical protein
MRAILQIWCQYSVEPPDYAMWTVVPDTYNVNKVPHILTSIFNWTYLRWYRWYVDNSMQLILQTLCQIQRTPSSLRYLNCGPWHIECIYSSAYSGFNIQQNVSLPLLEISCHFNERYNEHSMPNTAHNHQFTQCELRSRTYTMHLQLRILRLQYSSESNCAAIGDISTIQCALYCKLGAKCSANPAVYTMCTVVPDIYKVFTAPHSQATIFNWTWLRSY